MINKYAVKTSMTAIALATTLGLAACGNTDTDAGGMGGMSPSSSTASATPSSGSSSSVSAAFNMADVMFVRMMVPHHEQAVAMSDTLLAKSGVNPEVTALAEEIKAAQQPEIATMNGFLAAWGEDMGDGGMGGMNHGGDDGMATDAELQEFEQADGVTGQRLYLEMMTAHHTGAITMAQTEIKDGDSPEAIQLAQDIVTAQQQEITVMKDLLTKI